LAWSFDGCQYYGYALLGARQFAEFREHSRQVWQAFESSAVPSNVARVAFFCAIVPNAELDWPAMAARSLDRLDPAMDAGDADRVLMGAALYRAAQFTQARELLSTVATALEVAGNAGERERSELAYALCFAAMTHYQLGDLQQAERDLEKLNSLVDSFPENTSWTVQVPVRVLQAEATELIRGTPPH
jgi:tetratricopeptide (TPR) repeat protein